MVESRLFLIDATAFCYRAFYALRGLSTSFGQPTNAVYGFINILNKILKEKKPEFLAVCFDVSRDTFRLKKFAEYKIQRPPMPEGLSGQIPIIKEIISAYGIAIFEKEGFEADDIIATLAKRAKEKGIATTIVSSDKDILQLVDEGIAVFSPGKNEDTIYDGQRVFARFGVEPKRMTDVVALMGDDVDNIPGVAGIGEKTAVGLIKEFGSLEGLLNNIDKIKPPRLKAAVEGNIDKIKLNKELAVLDEEVALDFELEKLKVSAPNTKELFRLFKSLEFKILLKDLEAVQEEGEKQEAVVFNEAQLKELIGGAGEIILSGEDFNSLVFCLKDKVFRAGDPGTDLKNILSNPSIKKISHDLKKISVSLARQGVILEGLSFDTMLAGYLINPSKPGYNLADLAFDYLGELIKGSSVDSPKAVTLIRQLVPKLEKELQDRELINLFNEIEMPLVEVLAQMELTGIKLDTQVLDGLSRDLEKRLIQLIEDIYRMSGCQFNINSPKQLRDILFEKLKLPVVKRSKTGPSTDEEVLRKLADKHKLPKALLEYRQLMKLKNTYIDVLPGLIDPVTGRIHTSFNQTATETGRLSSSAPNLQNIPIKTDIGRNIRRSVVAFSKDSCLLSCDYSQIELRILAHICKDENLTFAFKNDKDIHKATASLIYGTEEKDVTDSMRETAKRVNFGIVYGLTSFGLSRDLGISVDEAQNFIDAYFSRYPKVKDYVEQQIDRAKKDGFVTTILGRRRYIPEINNKNQGIRQVAERQAINTPIQGSASDLIKLAMIQIHGRIKKDNHKARMILQIHDELLFDVPEGEWDELVDIVKDRMENVLKLDVPIRVDIKKGRNWLEMEAIKCG
ncbi:MAG: DNA polymerase I [Candidatus Omnitrophica bacterium]|nr:DNA polymerase I [Candidatus Omnitrophota bacterium]MDD5592364.1 DNA polymerase I [Candidatus Omnitrophota bacterium]